MHSYGGSRSPPGTGPAKVGAWDSPTRQSPSRRHRTASSHAGSSRGLVSAARRFGGASAGTGGWCCPEWSSCRPGCRASSSDSSLLFFSRVRAPGWRARPQPLCMAFAGVRSVRRSTCWCRPLGGRARQHGSGSGARHWSANRSWSEGRSATPAWRGPWSTLRQMRLMTGPREAFCSTQCNAAWCASMTSSSGWPCEVVGGRPGSTGLWRRPQPVPGRCPRATCSASSVSRAACHQPCRTRSCRPPTV